MSTPTPDQPATPVTSWPEWTCITQPDPSKPDAYHGECFRCGGSTDGVRSLVAAWARDDHSDCREGA